MEKVYVVVYGWDGYSEVDDSYCSWAKNIGVAKSLEEATAMCRNSRKEKIVEIMAEDPQVEMDIDEDGEGTDKMYSISFDNDPDGYLGLYSWWIEPFDLIGS